ncbi:hypothetical protein [Pseudoblastomonas halimionae]|uniref:Uncharacterized protein n=1 Tax=Alteriqipengyuania halimionae TaxID=1926630 RepID=A0A6I4U473_9SPHN|nr:hypothetical protein [Alteriqipengyuania halimionae]MXP09715.1 hypothetical protein [Alteriqipengyuania halimionae]
MDEKPAIPFYLQPHAGDPPRENWWDAPVDWLLTRRDRWQREAAERAAEAEGKSAALPPPDRRRRDEPEVEDEDEDEDERAAVVRRLKDRRWR